MAPISSLMCLILSKQMMLVVVLQAYSRVKYTKRKGIMGECLPRFSYISTQITRRKQHLTL